MSEFTWIPIYREIAGRVLQYETRQDELIDLLKVIKAQELKVIPLNDMDVGDVQKEIEEIDPFTFFATFNRGTTQQARIRIIEIIKDRWALNSDMPADYNGIPVVNNMMSWFFHYKKDRPAEEIPNLWRLARGVFERPVEELPFDDLHKCVERFSLLISMGMFWT